MRIKRLLLSLLFYALCLQTGKAAHLVGGEITYRCLGNSNYEITLLIYRDCLSNGAPFDPRAYITIYDQFNIIIANDSVPIQSISQLPLIAPNNCTSLPKTVCTEKAIYRYTVNLPPRAGGYTITHQRCCRNNTITNINNSVGSFQWGSTYTTSIPPMDAACNSSPKFNGDPPVVLCLNVDVSLDLSASDGDGDSLYYELCSALHGGSNNPNNRVHPSPADPPPYQAVPFLPGFSVQQPISSSPQFAIDPATGILSGTPVQVGQFVFAICVSEYRNGVKLSTTRRDFQFNVSSACQQILARIEPQMLNPRNLCSGGKIYFTNKSQFASKYFWDFGDPTTFRDTSHLANPTYHYQDTGTYQVMLVADPRSSCADTTYGQFKVFDSTVVEFTYSGNQCFEHHSLDFTAFGNFSQTATFSWDFGGPTVPNTNSTKQSPTNVEWTQPGTYYVSVTVTAFGCDHTYGDSIDIFVQPEIGEVVESTAECVPYTVHFKDDSKAMGPVEHLWVFGDGNTSNAPSPSHTYTTPGIYTVSHSIRTLRGCIDTGLSVYPGIVSIYPVPRSALEWDAKEKSIYDPVFHVINRSEGHSYTQTVLPDGREITNLTQATILLEDTGNYRVLHLSFNKEGCSDTLVDTIRVNDPFTLFIPSAFSPNGDGINDEFTFSMSGISSMEIAVYNRWGQIVYQSTNPYKGWNGSFNNTGRELPSGVYSYVFIGTLREGAVDHVEQGTVTLLR